jgi:hypothetical protein
MCDVRVLNTTGSAICHTTYCDAVFHLRHNRNAGKNGVCVSLGQAANKWHIQFTLST